MISDDYFYHFLSAEYNAQAYLQKCYQSLPDATSKSYQNSTAFKHYIGHGKAFFEASKQNNMMFQPILSFYGIVHLLKGWILTKRPNYPENTSLLAHGITARKRKRKDYLFMNDEVKIQQQGLFPYVSRYLFSLHPFPMDRVSMELLFHSIPELCDMWRLHEKSSMIIIGNKKDCRLCFPESILDSFYLKEDTFIERIRPYLPPIEQIQRKKGEFLIDLTTPVSNWNGPFRYHSHHDAIYFPVSRELYFPYSEIFAHYLILFNLSMICRYETEWWGELIQLRTDWEYPLIREFLTITQQKTPALIGQCLSNMMD